MTPELAQLILANLPNYAGFATLALVQWQVGKRAEARYDALMQRYDALVDTLVQGTILTQDTGRSLKAGDNRRGVQK